MKRLGLLAPMALVLAACGGGGGGGGIVPDGPIVATADFLHVTTSATVESWSSVIDHPVTNENPDAKLFVTHNWNPGGVGGIDHKHPLAVHYDDVAERWRIENADGDAMDTGIGFNVTVFSGLSSAWTHRATPSNIALDRTYLDHSSLNGRPTAVSLVQQNLVFLGMVGLSTSAPVGLWYDAPQWSVFMQDSSISMGADLHFNVYVVPDDGTGFRHTATAGNTSGNSTTISHPDADGNPNAHIQVTQGLGSGATTNDHDVGVFYDTSIDRWKIFNEDGLAISTNAVFYVRVLP